MKQPKKAGGRNVSKRARGRKRPAKVYPSQPVINEDDELMNPVEAIVKALVNASHGDFVADVQFDELGDRENDEDWLEHLKRSAEQIEQRLGALNSISSEDLHDSWKQLQEESPEPGAFPIERYLDQFLASLRDKFRKALFSARIERDALRLRMAVREEVDSLCSQAAFQAHDFIKLPPAFLDGETSNLSESERAEVTDLLCRSVWWMMADHYPEGCTTHFYLECPEGWFSAEVYGDEEEAKQEAEQRRLRGEGDFEIREINEGEGWVVFTVLFSKQRPKFTELANQETC
jgi:hypothetical protein